MKYQIPKETLFNNKYIHPCYHKQGGGERRVFANQGIGAGAATFWWSRSRKNKTAPAPRLQLKEKKYIH